ncbi:hypothetical protein YASMINEVIRUS_243 [Yasminevirus sp. GU-2018]|uniref:Uncharacterized protein n=1 Tax=Yasminevirus sp. GU-2018 TaxID=2420051 RepID=A0A5K0U7H7_9VIRU|nr:hypothetical protein YASMINEVIRUS_243 [Yasminevirus sp. GU-2018]
MADTQNKTSEVQVDTISISNIDNPLSALSVFIIISFICVVTIILYKSIADRFPTLFTLCALGTFIVVSSAILIVVGKLSITLEWTCVIVLTLSLLMSTFTILYPNVFFYPELS